MRKICRFWMASLVFAVMTFGEEKVTDAEKKTVVDGNNMFTIDLYRELKSQEGNLFFSGYSISTALAMTYAGTRGNTQTQMAKVLHFKLPQERLHPTFGEWIDELNARKRGYQLSIANALWGQKGYRFLEEFINLTKTHYGAGLNEVDFVRDTEAARNTINDWVEKQTEGKIKDIIKRGMINELTRLVLTNAIYFKGDWASKFDKKQTEDSPFYVAPDKTVNTPMMYKKGNFKYMETDKLQAIELPYIENELSMLVLLPKKIEGLVEIENLLTLDSLNKWLGNFRQHKVRVYLPRFKTTSEFSLGKVLADMGMPDAFSLPPADFSGMTGKKDLFISAVIHKAFVEVNEEGTEAAAATAVTVETTAVSEVLVFRADHPFVFLIRDILSGSILFLGRIVNPFKV